MKNVLKKAILILIVLITLFSINSKVFAWSEIIDDGQSFINKADRTKTPIDEQGLKNVSGFLYNVLLAAGIVIAVIIATVLGVQFMLEGAEGQAKVKEMLLPFVVGCIIVFGGFGFWKIAITLGESIEDVESDWRTSGDISYSNGASEAWDIAREYKAANDYSGLRQLRDDAEIAYENERARDPNSNATNKAWGYFNKLKDAVDLWWDDDYWS